jgi:hypothetical protein
MLAASLSVAHLPPDAEARIAEFSDLVATAISNIEAHADLAASRARVVAAAMRSGAVSSATCTTARSSGSCTPS